MERPAVHQGNIIGSPVYEGFTLGEIVETPGTFTKADYPGLRAIRVNGEITLADDLAAVETINTTFSGWKTFSPTLTASSTNPTLGSGGSTQGRYTISSGGLVTYRFHIQFGSSGANGGSGEYNVSVPVDISSTAPAGTTYSMGQAVLFDWSVAGHKELAVISRNSATTLQFYVKNATVFHNNPFTWTNNDRFGGTAAYEAATPSVEVLY